MPIPQPPTHRQYYLEGKLGPVDSGGFWFFSSGGKLLPIQVATWIHREGRLDPSLDLQTLAKSKVCVY